MGDPTKPTRHFFRKAIAPPPKVRKPKKMRLKGKAMKFVDAKTGRTHVASAIWVKQYLNGKAVATRIQVAGSAHRWTPEKAREAALKSWKHRARLRKGAPSMKAPAVNHKALRAHFAEHPEKGIQYHPQSGKWTSTTEFGVQLVSERAALMKAGILAPLRKHRFAFRPEIVNPVFVTRKPKETR